MTAGLAITPDAIRQALRSPLPGLKAQARMAPIPRPLRPPAPQHEPRQGGVLLLLYPGAEDDLFLVLTRRSDIVGNHRGQISLPGGSVDPGDRTTAQTALREACEEIGVCSNDLELLGNLTPLYIPPSDFCIHPHVAYRSLRPQFQPQPSEVAELLEVPLHHFLDNDNVAEEEWLRQGQALRVPFFRVGIHKVWGATAMVLAEFTAVLDYLETQERPKP